MAKITTAGTKFRPSASNTLAGINRSRKPVCCCAVAGVSTLGGGGAGMARDSSQMAPKVTDHMNK